MNQYGIKETEDVFDFLVASRDAYKASMSDGKFEFRSDFPNFINPAIKLPTAIDGADRIPKEWGNLDGKEIDRLRARYGELVDDERWQRAFIGIVIAGDAIKEIVTGEKATT